MTSCSCNPSVPTSQTNFITLTTTGESSIIWDLKSSLEGNSLKYSFTKDGEFTNLDFNTELTFGTNENNKKLYLKGTLKNPTEPQFPEAEFNRLIFKSKSSDTTITLAGNLMNLLGENITEVPAFAFYELFYAYDTNGVFPKIEIDESTEKLLPATKLSKACYSSMFRECNLLTIPTLPATTLAEGCYNEMFESCKYLTKAANLPATTLANECYKQMFNNCSSIEIKESGENSNKIFTCPDISTLTNPVTNMFTGTKNHSEEYTPSQGKTYYWA